jgi:hypothetical protein
MKVVEQREKELKAAVAHLQSLAAPIGPTCWKIMAACVSVPLAYELLWQPVTSIAASLSQACLESAAVTAVCAGSYLMFVAPKMIRAYRKATRANQAYLDAAVAELSNRSKNTAKH